MVSIKKIFGSSTHDDSATDGGDLRHATTGSQGRTSGHETDARRKNDELARSVNTDNSTNNDSSLGHRKSLSGANNSTGLVGSNSPRTSTSNRDSTTGYNTESSNLPSTMGAYNGPPGVGPTGGLIGSDSTHATNEHAKGIHNKGLDNIGSHRGLVGEHPETTTGASADGSRPIVEVVSREAVPGTAKGAQDHILHTHTGIVSDNDRSAVDNTPRQAAVVPTPVSTDRTGHGRLSSSSSGRGFDQPHESGHVASKIHHEFDPKLATHDHQHLQHVTHKQVRHVEVEEVERQREVDRHIHHVQTHVQPVLDKKILPEKISENVIAPTKVHEVHASTPEDVSLFTNLATQHRDTESHRAKERTVVDLGEKVNEKVIHHVHHVTQPIIEQEIVERHRIHTVIPVHHVTHEAPIIHKSSTHAPVSLDDFLQGGGKLDSRITHETSGLLDNDDCAVEVNGPAEKLLQDLNLGTSVLGHSHSHSRDSTSGSTSGKKDYVSKDGDHHGSKIGQVVDNATPSNDRIGSTKAI